jgi:ubiquinone/menaquinone biosynthesis C-methylase UbiE
MGGSDWPIARIGKWEGTYRAPIDRPARVLDVGRGTGIWVMDFGEYVSIPHTSHSSEADAIQSAYKESHIIGIDLSPIQPTW